MILWILAAAAAGGVIVHLRGGVAPSTPTASPTGAASTTTLQTQSGLSLQSWGLR